MSDEIDIPASVHDPKPWWETRPKEELVQEILGFIQRTGKPYLWAGQTYDRPDRDSIPVYLAEFHMPASKPLTPCPCCRPRHPKYRHGIIAYFPDEHVIRIMGYDCFKAINSEQHVEALRNFHAEVQRKKDISYLLDNLGKVPDLINIVTDASPIGHAVDDLRNKACVVFKEVLRCDLYEYIKTGELKHNVTRFQFFPISQLEEEEREISTIERYGRISGQDMLKARSTRLGLKLDNIVLALQQIDFGTDHQAIASGMNDKDRRETAKLLGKAFETANAVFRQVEELRQFTTAVTISTLNGWARQEGAPVRFFIAFDGSSLCIGHAKHSYRRIAVPPAYLRVLKTLPKLGSVQSAAA